MASVDLDKTLHLMFKEASNSAASGQFNLDYQKTADLGHISKGQLVAVRVNVDRSSIANSDIQFNWFQMKITADSDDQEPVFVNELGKWVFLEQVKQLPGLSMVRDYRVDGFNFHTAAQTFDFYLEFLIVA